MRLQKGKGSHSDAKGRASGDLLGSRVGAGSVSFSAKRKAIGLDVSDLFCRLFPAHRVRFSGPVRSGPVVFFGRPSLPGGVRVRAS